VRKIRKLTDTDKSSIRDYIRQGLSTPEIMKRMEFLYTHQQIAALKAHMTMESQAFEISLKRKKLNKITDTVRANIIEQALNKRTTSQIMKSLGGRYTRQQIAAVRAHVTMGSY